MRLVVVLSLKIRLASGVSCIVVISCRIMPTSESGDRAARAWTRLCQIRKSQFTLPRHQPLTYHENVQVAHDPLRCWRCCRSRVWKGAAHRAENRDDLHARGARRSSTEGRPYQGPLRAFTTQLVIRIAVTILSFLLDRNFVCERQQVRFQVSLPAYQRNRPSYE